MLFNSLHFLIFFPIVVVLYFSIPHKFRWVLLLAASIYFYMNFIPIYILVLFLLIIIDYVMALLIEKSQGHKRKIYLITSILSTCSVLFIFKYFNFFNQNVSNLAQFLHWNYSFQALTLALPIGLSFHTFQSLNYVLEVYAGNQKAERHFGIYSLYVLFFPQLVAGPIERAKNLLHQFYENHFFDYKSITYGLKLMLWGFFLKIVIADRLAIIVNQIYNNVSNYTGFPLIIATYFFSFQIYCDFAGYSLIAIGAAKIMGFNLMQNFRRPYLSKSISEFWKRWHISLSSWFRDYLYIPLGGNRVSKQRWLLNLFIVFLVSGLWHGAAWTFVIWGGLHGSYLILSIITQNIRTKFTNFTRITKFPKIYGFIQILITFHLVLFGWIFFRANSLKDAVYIINHLFTNFGSIFLYFNHLDVSRGIVENFLGLGTPDELLLITLFIAFVGIVHLFQERVEIIQFLKTRPTLRWTSYFVIVLMILLFGVFNKVPFIYFQF